MRIILEDHQFDLLFVGVEIYPGEMLLAVLFPQAELAAAFVRWHEFCFGVDNQPAHFEFKAFGFLNLHKLDTSYDQSNTLNSVKLAFIEVALH